MKMQKFGIASIDFVVVFKLKFKYGYDNMYDKCNTTQITNSLQWIIIIYISQNSYIKYKLNFCKYRIDLNFNRIILQY